MARKPQASSVVHGGVSTCRAAPEHCRSQTGRQQGKNRGKAEGRMQNAEENSWGRRVDGLYKASDKASTRPVQSAYIR